MEISLVFAHLDEGGAEEGLTNTNLEKENKLLLGIVRHSRRYQSTHIEHGSFLIRMVCKLLTHVFLLNAASHDDPLTSSATSRQHQLKNLFMGFLEKIILAGKFSGTR